MGKFRVSYMYILEDCQGLSPLDNVVRVAPSTLMDQLYTAHSHSIRKESRRHRRPHYFLHKVCFCTRLVSLNKTRRITWLNKHIFPCEDLTTTEPIYNANDAERRLLIHNDLAVSDLPRQPVPRDSMNVIAPASTEMCCKFGKERVCTET